MIQFVNVFESQIEHESAQINLFKFCIFKKYQTLVLRATFGGWIVIIKYWQEGSKLRGRGMVQHVLEIVVRLVRCCYQLKKGIPRSSSLSRCNHFQTLHTPWFFVLIWGLSLNAPYSAMFFEVLNFPLKRCKQV